MTVVTFANDRGTEKPDQTGVPPAHKFTGKERDSESGLDYFGARYNSSSLGRFMSPDWSASPMGVPYAVFGNPQSLNLYSYVENNPLSQIDPTGHCTADGETHGFFWCLGHLFGGFETQKQYDARIADERQWLNNNVATNAEQRTALQGYSSSQVDKLYWNWTDALYKARCSGFLNYCENIPEARNFYRTASGSFALYRGGWFDNVTDFKLDANGNVRAGEGARGPSLFDDPARIPPRFTEINRIGELPEELMIKQVGKAGHYEIVPRAPGMSVARFLELLQKILKEPVE